MFILALAVPAASRRATCACHDASINVQLGSGDGGSGGSGEVNIGSGSGGSGSGAVPLFVSGSGDEGSGSGEASSGSGEKISGIADASSGSGDGGSGGRSNHEVRSSGSGNGDASSGSVEGGSEGSGEASSGSGDEGSGGSGSSTDDAHSGCMCSITSSLNGAPGSGEQSSGSGEQSSGSGDQSSSDEGRGSGDEGSGRGEVSSGSAHSEQGSGEQGNSSSHILYAEAVLRYVSASFTASGAVDDYNNHTLRDIATVFAAAARIEDASAVSVGIRSASVVVTVTIAVYGTAAAAASVTVLLTSSILASTDALSSALQAAGISGVSIEAMTLPQVSTTGGAADGADWLPPSPGIPPPSSPSPKLPPHVPTMSSPSSSPDWLLILGLLSAGVCAGLCAGLCIGLSAGRKVRLGVRRWSRRVRVKSDRNMTAAGDSLRSCAPPSSLPSEITSVAGEMYLPRAGVELAGLGGGPSLTERSERTSTRESPGRRTEPQGSLQRPPELESRAVCSASSAVTSTAVNTAGGVPYRAPHIAPAPLQPSHAAVLVAGQLAEGTTFMPLAIQRRGSQGPPEQSL